ncbi:MAG: pimeloyl-[acyl-carrier protein] methyl ester esterase [Lysobacterales bacterium]|jgi:pimeloyl-[acyl-carrier protein] methyl ester esterase
MCARGMIQVTGNGPNLVLVHGWGMHKGVWGDFSRRLSETFTLHLVELPGHGDEDRENCEFNLAQIAGKLSEQAPKASWLGWSLGGLIAAKVALEYPEYIDRLILLGTNPSFVKTNDWEHAQDPQVFEDFSASLEKDLAQTLARFNHLQVAGSLNARNTLRLLQANQPQLPAIEALRCGLKILSAQDLSKELQNIKTPSLVVGGSLDALVPIDAVRMTARRIPGAKLHVCDGAGHAPFLSHSQELFSVISQFLERRIAA